MPHGQGTMFYSDTGEVYAGIFQNGLRDGSGVCFYRDGFQYEGMWKLDKQINCTTKGELLLYSPYFRHDDDTIPLTSSISETCCDTQDKMNPSLDSVISTEHSNELCIECAPCDQPLRNPETAGETSSRHFFDITSSLSASLSCLPQVKEGCKSTPGSISIAAVSRATKNNTLQSIVPLKNTRSCFTAKSIAEARINLGRFGKEYSVMYDENQLLYDEGRMIKLLCAST
mmetsp:Transcript_40996/g.47919  ORF Transcript_40996/g.47919 Transcript_40996/m.47919 type:complete len:229 (-) Transcript_40996:122-808(-)